MGITYNQIDEIKEIKHGLIEDLIEIGKQKGKLQEVDMLSHAIKNLCKVIEDGEMELEEKEGGFSGRYAQARGGGQGGSSGYYAGRNYAGRYYAGDMDYAQHGNMMMPPDYYYSMAQGGGQGGGQGGSSGARGRVPGAARDSMGRYSSHGNLSSEIYSLMGEARNEMERQELEKLAEKLQRMEQG